MLSEKTHTEVLPGAFSRGKVRRVETDGMGRSVRSDKPRDGEGETQRVKRCSELTKSLVTSRPGEQFYGGEGGGAGED